MTNQINVTPFSNRADLMKKRLMQFLKWLEVEYKKADKGGVDISGLTVELKTIRRIKKVVSGNANLTFELGNKGNVVAGETYLDNSDAFMPFDMAFGFLKTQDAAATGNPIVNPSNAEVLSYPDKTVFPDITDATAPPEWSALLSYYWGTWELQVNKKTVMSEIHSERLLKVAQVQQYANAAAMPYVQDGRYAPLFNNPLLDGNKTIEFVFRPVPDANTNNAGGATGTTNYGVLDLHGFVVKDLSTSLNALNTPFYFV